MKKLSRRDLFAVAAGAGVPAMAKPAVALVQGEDRAKNIYNALLTVDDQIRPALKSKKYVLIKPNGVAVNNQLGSTHADALRGILEYLGPRFKGPIVIAESSKDNTWDAYENFGYPTVVKEYGSAKIKLVDLNDEAGYRTLEVVDKDVHAAPVRLAGRLFDPDAFILGSAILKAHDVAVATLSVKNMVMSAPLHAPGKNSQAWHDKYKYHAGYRQMHVNLLLTAKQLWPYWGATVIDGYEGMEGEGPLRGTPVASRVAIASTDLVAADRVGVEAMGVDPEWVGYLRYCSNAGLGKYDLDKIELRGGVEIAAIRKKYKLHPRIERQLEWMGPLKPEEGKK
jgi:uncharacterized protein (DUF362 family)